MAGKPGRPGKLDATITAALCEGIEHGLTYEGACARAGVHFSTFCRWRARGSESRSGRYREFCDALQEAENKARASLETVLNVVATGGFTVKEVRTVTKGGAVVEQTVIEKEAAPDARIALAILERRHPAVWARKDLSKAFEDVVTCVRIVPYPETEEIRRMNSNILPAPEDE